MEDTAPVALRPQLLILAFAAADAVKLDADGAGDKALRVPQCFDVAPRGDDAGKDQADLADEVVALVLERNDIGQHRLNPVLTVQARGGEGGGKKKRKKKGGGEGGCVFVYLYVE